MRITKKITAFLLAFLLVISPATAVSYATETPGAEGAVLKTEITPEEFSADENITVTVSLIGTLTTRNMGLDFESAYDHTAFEWVSGDWTPEVKAGTLLAPTHPGDQATFAAMTALNLTGEIYTFVLKPIDGAASCAEPYEIKVLSGNSAGIIGWEGDTVSFKHVFDDDCDEICNGCSEKLRDAKHVYDHVGDADCNRCGTIRQLPTYISAVRRGDEVKVAVSITGQAEVRGFGLDFKTAYDHAAFEWIGGDWSAEILANATLQQTNPANEAVFGAQTAFTVSGEVYSFTLRVKENAAFGDYEVLVGLRGDVPTTLSTTVITVHECAPTEEFFSDEASHWNACLTYACPLHLNEVPHDYDNACDTDCNTCGEVRTITHDYSVQDKNDTEHWMKCSVCGEVDETTVKAHDYSVQDKDGENHWMKCSVCGDVDETTVKAHDYSVPEKDAEKHWMKCPVCGDIDDDSVRAHDYSIQDKDEESHWMKCSCGVIDESTRRAHDYDHACDTDCNTCGEVRTITHDFSVRDKNETEHWMKCSVCGEIDEDTRAAHIHDNACDTDCNTCSMTRQVPDHVYDDSHDLICNECGFERPPYTPGDVDGNGSIDLEDVIQALFHLSFADSYPVNQPLDFDGNGIVDIDDVVHLLFYLTFPDSYPLQNR